MVYKRVDPKIYDAFFSTNPDEVEPHSDRIRQLPTKLNHIRIAILIAKRDGKKQLVEDLKKKFKQEENTILKAQMPPPAVIQEVVIQEVVIQEVVIQEVVIEQPKEEEHGKSWWRWLKGIFGSGKKKPQRVL